MKYEIWVDGHKLPKYSFDSSGEAMKMAKYVIQYGKVTPKESVEVRNENGVLIAKANFHKEIIIDNWRRRIPLTPQAGLSFFTTGVNNGVYLTRDVGFGIFKEEQWMYFPVFDQAREYINLILSGVSEKEAFERARNLLDISSSKKGDK